MSVNGSPLSQARHQGLAREILAAKLEEGARRKDEEEATAQAAEEAELEAKAAAKEAAAALHAHRRP